MFFQINRANAQESHNVQVNRQCAINPIKAINKKDSVYFTGTIKHQEWNGNVSAESQTKMIDSIIDICSGNVANAKLLGCGADGSVYRVSNIPDYPNGVAVKISNDSEINSQTGEMQRVGKDFKEERTIMSALPDNLPKTKKMIGYIELNNGRNILITTLVNGKEADTIKNPLTTKHLENILTTLFELDKKGVLHRDLKKENILLEGKEDIGLIDFGAAVVLDLKDIENNAKEHHIPPFMMPSNIRNFEDTSLAPYLNELSKTNRPQAIELFTDYLKLRAEHVHKPAVEFLDRYLEENAETLTPEQIEQLEKAKEFEKNQAVILSKPKPEIVDIELSKIQITYSSELAYKNELLLLNPLANMSLKLWSLMSIKRLEGKVDKLLNRPNDTNTKEYLETQKDICKFRQGKIVEWSKGLFGWLINCGEKGLKDANSGEQAIQEQFMKKGINNFEIPDLAENLNAN